MLLNEEEGAPLGPFLLKVVAGIFFVWAAWTGYNYFKPPLIPPPIPGDYSDEIQWKSIHDGEEEFKDGKRCILYDFTAEWCPSCRAMAAELYTIKPVAQFINQYFIPIMVVDRVREEGRNPRDIHELRKKYGVDAFPTLVVRYPNEQYKKQEGYGLDYTVQFLHGAVGLN
jgi:thiol:disulfide interchange protein